MTFIASVIAKDGVAIIADSLVTSSRPVIELRDFISFVSKKTEENGGEKVDLSVPEIVSLFNSKPSHTKDFEEKLFKFDKYTALTTAGNAEINGKRIKDIVLSITKTNNAKFGDKSYDHFNIEDNMKDFCDHVDREIKEHLKDKNSIDPTIFIFSHYNPTNRETFIYKIKTLSGSKKDLEKPDIRFIEPNSKPEDFKIVCDGQNRISEMILYGGLNSILEVLERFARKVNDDFDLKGRILEEGYRSEMVKHCLTNEIQNDFKINQLTNLSLQQAVDLASLLMNIEISFQKYTKNIPTVGGVIKVATIGQKGFSYVTGNKILRPKII